MRILTSLLAASFVGQAAAADDCRRQSRLWQEINVSSGLYSEQAVARVPLKIRIPAGVDANAMAECLRMEGFDPPASMAAELGRVEDCRLQARSLRLTERSGSGPLRLGSEIDDSSYRECLRQEVGVEVLPPD